MNSDANIQIPDSLLHRLDDARRVFVLTGAGMSAESGIPTFRDAQTGMWANYRAEDLATPEAFNNNPERVWNWYEERRSAIQRAAPHAGHKALVKLESMLPALCIATQNVDGLHQLAGSENVIELHGNIMKSICHITHREIDPALISASDHVPPRSPYSSRGLARPAVVWFGETLPSAAIEASIEAAATCDFCFSIGTTSLVQPAAGLPLIALEHGACLVEINPQETAISMHADYRLKGTAADILGAIARHFSDANQRTRSARRL